LQKAQKQAKCLKAGAQSTDADPVTLRYLRWKYTQISPRPVKDPNIFYGVRLGQVAGFYTK